MMKAYLYGGFVVLCFLLAGSIEFVVTEAARLGREGGLVLKDKDEKDSSSKDTKEAIGDEGKVVKDGGALVGHAGASNLHDCHH